MATNPTTKTQTLYQTPGGVFTVVAKQDVGTMKAGQTGHFEFTQMRFGFKIMVTGTFWDWLEYTDPLTNEPVKLQENVLGFYKPMTYTECLAAFDFPTLFDEQDFTKLFENYKPAPLP